MGITTPKGRGPKLTPCPKHIDFRWVNNCKECAKVRKEEEKNGPIKKPKKTKTEILWESFGIKPPNPEKDNIVIIPFINDHNKKEEDLSFWQVHLTTALLHKMLELGYILQEQITIPLYSQSLLVFYHNRAI